MSDDDSIRDYHDTASIIDEVECRLNEREARERADWVESEFLPHLERVEETEDGYYLFFPNGPEALQAAVEAVLLESRCCADQSFALEVPADDSEIRLAFEGPEGTKELAREGFFETFEDAPSPEG